MNLKTPSGRQRKGYLNTYGLDPKTENGTELLLWFNADEKIFFPDELFVKRFDPGVVKD